MLQQPRTYEDRRPRVQARANGGAVQVRAAPTLVVRNTPPVGTLQTSGSVIPSAPTLSILAPEAAGGTGKPKLLDQVRDAIRTRHYSHRTEEAYVGWIRRFILFHKKRHPAEMGKVEIEQFLTALAVQHNVAAST